MKKASRKNVAGLHLWEVEVMGQSAHLWITSEKNCAVQAAANATAFLEEGYNLAFVSNAPKINKITNRGFIDA